MADESAIAEAEFVAERSFDTSSPDAVNKARTRAGRARREQLEVVGGLMDVVQGRAWLYSVLEGCHVFATSFVPGDPHGTSFKEGERNAGLRVLADIMTAAPDKYVDMVKEARAKQRV